jgi:hypothetical protein
MRRIRDLPLEICICIPSSELPALCRAVPDIETPEKGAWMGEKRQGAEELWRKYDPLYQTGRTSYPVAAVSCTI